MDETLIKNAGSDSTIQSQQLKELYESMIELRELVEAQQRDVVKLREENAQLKRENAQLKRLPLFVAVVIEKMAHGEVYLRQQGNNQEYITHAGDDIYPLLKTGSKVAVNNALSIVKVVGTTFDSRVRVMELDTSPSQTFDQIGGLTNEIEEVREAVEYPLTRPEVFRRLGVEPPKGILLYGPPGTGKTLIAKAIAHNANATFIRMSGSELVHKFIGEGAQLVRELFQLAREKAPSIVFIDEIDAVGSTRTHDGTSGSAEVQRTLMQLLAEMDGFDNRGEIRIMAATNRPDMLDPALLRPGRFDRMIEIPYPDVKSRLEILKIHAKNLALSTVDLNEIATGTDGATGAELEAICREAGMIAVRESADSVDQNHFTTALRKVRHEKPEPDSRMYL
ncbi:proteasome-activating nucleotidase [Methanocalculus sp.]|uniref:proteasome-activating nucleotidase n=1 Tax=Methanocalculus sp. TaxID=2004547 RepID=UPI0027233C3E|nr:proteasome-activating nucleotidase [Methanocalculus sp.]MDO8841521.1 proteasome-activating nucleotidase [Methanocalculus sp.]